MGDVIEMSGGNVLVTDGEAAMMVESDANLPASDRRVPELVPTGLISRQGHYVTAEDAYLVYVSRGARSLRKTAEVLGVPHGTVLSWSTRQQWRQRILDTDMEVAEGVVQAATVALMAQQLRNIETLVQIRDGTESMPSDRIGAVRQLSGMFEKIQAQVAKHAILGGGDDVTDEDDLKRLAETAEGANQLLAMLRERTGKA